MLRKRPSLVGFIVVGLGLLAWGALGVVTLRADEAKPAKEAKVPPLASDEVVVEALKVYKTAFRAKGYKGEEKIAEQDWALRQLAKVQHAKVVDALTKVTKHKSDLLRTAAVIQLGNQRRLPGYAGRAVVDAMKRQAKDSTFLMAGLDAIAKLRYMGAKAILARLMKHHDYAVVKNTLVTIGRMEDKRFIDDIVKLLKDLKIEKGAKWDGASATYDSGAAGDHDQKVAEKMAKAALAKNKAKGKRAAKSMRDLGPVVLEVAFQLTGRQFSGGVEARKWLGEHRAQVDTDAKVIEEIAEKQAAAAKGLKKRR